ncbi:MAG: shikimate dehydrogenase [Bacteroidetes bacterium]|nr:MAG: shikimate dehydrogenase [Bacteroidota bacterium]
MENLYGLIGFPLSHSFSKKYFTEKFLNEGLTEHRYELFEINDINEIVGLINNHPQLVGLNVTIPHKETIIPYLDHLDKSAKIVGAVNVIKIRDNLLTGYNSDFFGFESSLLKFIGSSIENYSAIVLGTGGAAKAVIAVLMANKIPYRLISRSKGNDVLTYDELNNTSIIADSNLIINTTPLGMAPKIDSCPDIDYNQLSNKHFVFDLIYNPAETKFLEKARAKKTKVKNGLEMLELQAEKSWEIWTS